MSKPHPPGMCWYCDGRRKLGSQESPDACGTSPLPDHVPNPESILALDKPQKVKTGKDVFTPLEPLKADGCGLRYNSGKNRLDLLPTEWLWALGLVTTRGSIKYAERNWERGMLWSTMVGCALRHSIKFICGEKYDAETGCHHLAMAAWNLLALMSYDIRKVGTNDLTGRMDWLEAVATDMGPELKALDDAKRASG